MFGRILSGLFTRAINKPHVADAGGIREDSRFLRARAAYMQGEHALVETLLHDLIASNTGSVDVYCLYGGALLGLQRHAEAEQQFYAALKLEPSSIDALIGLGHCRLSMGDARQAYLHFHAASRYNPENAELAALQGQALFQMGNLQDALPKFETAFRLRSDSVHVVNSLGVIYQKMMQRDKALAFFKRAIALDSENVVAWSNAGLILRELNRNEESLIHLRRAADLDHDNVQTRVNLATGLLESGMVDEAKLIFLEIQAAHPDKADTYCNLGILAKYMNQHHEAANHFLHALRLAPNFPRAMYGLGEIFLAEGNFEQGWKGYEYRFKTGEPLGRRYPFPVWDGAACPEKTVLIFEEQGLGDIIMFASCIPEVLKQVRKCVIIVPARLRDLIARSFPEAIVFAGDDVSIVSEIASQGIDYQLPIGSLPSLFRNAWNTFPNHAGYLMADPSRIIKWRRRLQNIGFGMKVGIAWRGGLVMTGRQFRSLDLCMLHELLTMDGKHFISLQHGNVASEIEEYTHNYKGALIHWEEAVGDIDEMAALIMALDLVITVCSTTVHLSGALGKSAWVMTPKPASWRYLLDGTQLPWYPSVRMYRQASEGDWQSVLDAIRLDLKSFVVPAWTPAGLLERNDHDIDKNAEDGHLEDQSEARRFDIDAICENTDEPLSRDELMRLLDQHPDNPEIYARLGVSLFHHGDTVSALDQFELAQFHGLANVKHLLGMAWIYLRQNSAVKAIESAERVIGLDPMSEQGWLVLGYGHFQAKEYEQAIKAFKRLLDINPCLPEGIFGLGRAYAHNHDYKIAAEMLTPLLVVHPNNLSVKTTLGTVLAQQGIKDEALKLFDEVLSVEPNNFYVKWQMAQLRLAAGDFARGWDDYEFRYQADVVAYRPLPFPVWAGEQLNTKTMLVIAEQGLGDEIMFVSCLPDVIARAGHVVLECNSRLKELFARSFPSVTVYGGQQEQTPKWLNETPRIDFQIHAGSLPKFFRRSRSDFPDHAGYLTADAAMTRKWRTLLNDFGAGMKIGISWRGGMAKTRAKLRSMPLLDWAPILTTPGCQFVNLQYGDCGADLNLVRETLGVDIFHDQAAIDDYDQTAALVSGLDLVISVCTAVIHLSGGLGKPVWILVPSIPEWRYMHHEERLPWYPSSRTFRQLPEESNWERVIGAVAEELRQRVVLG